MELAEDFLDHAIVARLPVVIKARTPDSSGRRIVEVEASTETKDFDGDVVLQKALLDSAGGFIASGHLDIDHLSEFGARMGIANPSSYIVGRPTAVKGLDGGRTFVEGEIARSRDGSFNPTVNRYDEFWASLQSEPPVRWFSSIYGFPTDLDDCKAGACGASGATRFLIKAIDWRSLAFTRSPKNTGLRSPTRIVSAKSYLAELVKGMIPGDVPTAPAVTEGMDGPPFGMVLPNTMSDVWTAKSCPGCAADSFPSVTGYRYHFAKCLGYPEGAADLFAHAVMYKHEMARRIPALG